ncbi:hypothetical protein KPL71_004419 [Citrus sinensis]|uniref:Uncharacterized protein n=1 Tax=Citrus sinensis TaxID=2711 RepID=A0ACB8N4M5_CITSI|nr:hypothetical protein KPL71_004419 [Citrus sinensis]
MAISKLERSQFEKIVKSTCSSSWKPLPEDVLQKTVDSCDQRRVVYVPPNLCAVVGSSIAARLMAGADVLSTLAKMPAHDVEVLDRHERIPCMRKRTCQLLADKLKEATSIDLKREDRSGSFGR